MHRFGMHQADALTTSKIQQRFNSFAAENKNYRSIPALDRNALVANSVTTNKTVRYRGLVQVISALIICLNHAYLNYLSQDVFEIEYFVGISNHHSDINSAYLKYRDTSGGSDGQYGEDGAVMERFNEIERLFLLALI